MMFRMFQSLQKSGYDYNMVNHIFNGLKYKSKQLKIVKNTIGKQS